MLALKHIFVPSCMLANLLQENDPALNTNDISVYSNASKTFKVNKPFQLSGFFKEKPSDKLINVAVYSPSGWDKEITTNAQGIAEFTPI